MKNLIAATDFPTYKQWVLANISADTECDIVGVNGLRILLQVRKLNYKLQINLPINSEKISKFLYRCINGYKFINK